MLLQVSSLLRCFDKPDDITYYVRNIQQQTDNTRLCGYYAAAAALSICSNIDPTANVYDEELIVMEVDGRLAGGTTEPLTCIADIGDQTNIIIQKHKKLHCKCQQQTSNLMISCTGCGTWFHESCVEYIPTPARKNVSIPWFSKVCCPDGVLRYSITGKRMQKCLSC